MRSWPGASRRAGGGAAEAEFCGRFWQRARLYGLRHLRGVTDAEDLAQQVMEVTLKALRTGRVDDLDLLDRYVLGVCRNVAHTLRRSGERTERAARRLALEPAPALEQPPEPPWGTHLVERLTSCLTELSRREQGVVQSSFSERRSSAEIAEQLGITPGNVRVIRHRALEGRGELMSENPMQPGEHRQAAFPEGGRLLIHRLAGLDLTRVDRVNLALSTPEGAPLTRFKDVPFERNTGEVIATYSVDHVDWS